MSDTNQQEQPNVLWSAYLATESHGSRTEMLNALRRFIAAIALDDSKQREKWVTTFCAQHEANPRHIPVREPLFRQVLFPVLLEGLKVGRPHCARWLAGLDQNLYQNKELWEQAGYLTGRELLQKALVVDPQDYKAKQYLISAMADGFRYTIHELPSGVLYDANGTTPDKCDELMADLNEFEQLAASIGKLEDYRQLIYLCRQHYVWYKDYLQNRSSFSSYQEYLEQHDEYLTDHN